ncbi:MAG: phosphate regulon sensor histidine kinase PhoR [Glaciecola sp.]|jgi:two-component system phosphate regulon sensor histidine kinase PhoR|nr:phosphate regulon sensor histidine kinase PhoR [Glaciecola sp.]MDG1816912.1 phosphate regulon sensor histidine kinase PhoR [Glaciecola sp.]MDG2100009.1 phosphate regulon sensor histidine kinase PhoR [Glaciecola sp.]
MYYPFSWSKNIVQLAIFFVLIIVLAGIFDDFVLATALAMIAMLGFNFYQLYKLNQWVWQSKKLSPPKVYGAWEYIYEGIYQLQRRQRGKRRELSELVKRFRKGAEALPDAVVILDNDSTIIWCNRLARLELGIKWPDDLGMRIDNLLRHPEFVEYFHTADFTHPIEVPSPANPRKTNEYRIMPYGDDNLLLISRDVTRVSQLEDMRRDFVANVSHEMRTPLTVINGYLEMLPSTSLNNDPLAQKAMYEMSTQTKRMQNLIEDLLILSRIESSSERIYENIVNMPSMFAQIAMEARQLNTDKQHTIEFHIDPQLHVYGVEGELRSACSNLIFNAVHYTPDGGNINVYWYKEGSDAVFKVVDDGDGIDDKHLLRLTERFYRVDKARSRKTGGSGLGLSIVKHVLNHHNSLLEIRSIVGQGSEFSFTLGHELIPVESSNKSHAK